MNADLGALATRLYVTIDDLLKDHPDWQPERPAVGIAPQLTDAELVTLAAVQALLGYTSERRFIRYAHTHLRPWFSFLPHRAACNTRLRAACNMMQHVIGAIARDCPSYTDDLWVVDSTPRRMRPLPRNRQTIGHGRLRQLRVLRQPLPLFLGTTTPPDRDTIGSARRLRVDQRNHRRTRLRTGDDPSRPQPVQASQSSSDGRQGLPIGQLRSRTQRHRDHPSSDHHSSPKRPADHTNNF